MNDAELLQRLQTTPVAQYSLEEARELLARFDASPTLQRAVLHQLNQGEKIEQLRERLAPTKSPGQATATPESAPQPPGGKSRTFVRAGLVLLTGLVLIVTTWLVAGPPEPPPEQSDSEVAASDPEQPPASDEGIGTPATPDQEHQEPPAASPQEDPELKPEDQPPADADPTNPKEPQEPPPPAASTGPKTPPPWQSVLDEAGPAPDFDTVSLDQIDTRRALLSVNELRRWFAPVPGEPQQIVEKRTRLGRRGGMRGLLRCLAPWHEDTALRLSLEQYHLLQIHFFHGQQGTSLVYFQDRSDLWAAYRTTRRAGEPRPETFALTATDEDRNRRTEVRYGGEYELRWRDGQIVLTRGDVVLLRAPLPEPPEEVYFEGKATFHGLELIRSQGLPASEEDLPETASIIPAEQTWDRSALPADAALETRPDGSVELLADESATRGYITLPLDRLRPGVIDLLIEDATPGTSVFLGRAQGPLETLRFVESPDNQHTCLVYRGLDDEWQQKSGQFAKQPVAAVSRSQWIRLMYGAGVFRWWTSTDGKSWARLDHGYAGQVGGVVSVGLHHVAGRPRCRIRISRIVIRELPGLDPLASNEVLRQAIAAPEHNDLGSWLAEVMPRQPVEMDPALWRRASALRTLAAGTSSYLGLPLVQLLKDETESLRLPLDPTFLMLDSLTLLENMHGSRATTDQALRRFYDLGARSPPGPVSSVLGRIMNSRMISPHSYRVADAAAIREELIERVSRQQWAETLDMCHRLRFYQLHQQMPLVEWAEATARRETRTRLREIGDVRQRPQWRQPLVEELNKEVYNTLAEFNGLLASESFADAARLISRVDSARVQGLAPHAQDRQLLVSLPAAIRSAQARRPALRRAIQDELAALSELRVRQAIAEGDRDRVQLATLQFAGTPAAAEAHQWLGDQALASGWFRRAEAQYEQGRDSVAASLVTNLEARLRLAAAMQGRDRGTAPTEVVEFAESRLAPADFEALVKELRERHQRANQRDPQAAKDAVGELPAPQNLQPQLRGMLDGAVGEQIDSEVLRNTKRHELAWVERQLAVSGGGPRFWVSNRFQVAAYNAADGNRAWQTSLPGRAARAQDWTLNAMRPLLVGKRLYARQLSDKGPVLVCLDQDSGALQWSSEPHKNEFLITDPVLLRGELVGLTLAKSSQQISLVYLTTWDQDSGEVTTQNELLAIRDVWLARRYAELIVGERDLFATLGGITISINPAGHVRWVRKQVLLPADEEPTWNYQYYQRPVMVEGKLYVLQPGVRTLECIEPETGRLVWQRVLVNVRRWIAAAGNRVVLENDEGLLALNAETGETLWQLAVPDRLEGILADSNHVIVAVREEVADKRYQPRLLWVDSQTGQPRGACPLPQLAEADPRLGPLFIRDGRLWGFYGKGRDDPQRQLVDFQPAGGEFSVPRPSTTATRSIEARWWASTAGPLQEDLMTRFEGWQLWNYQPHDANGPRAEAHGEKDVFALSSGPRPILWARHLKLAQGRPRLRMQIGRPPERALTLTVRWGTEVIWTRTLDPKATPEPWQVLQVDLRDRAGKKGWLTIEADAIEGASEYYWKTIDVLY